MKTIQLTDDEEAYIAVVLGDKQFELRELLTLTFTPKDESTHWEYQMLDNLTAKFHTEENSNDTSN